MLCLEEFPVLDLDARGDDSKPSMEFSPESLHGGFPDLSISSYQTVNEVRGGIEEGQRPKR